MPHEDCNLLILSRCFFDKICSGAGKVELNRDHTIYFILCIICGCLAFTLVRSLRL